MNYAELIAAVEDTTENTFTADQLALFAQQTEQKIYNAVQIPALRKNMVGNVSQGVPYLSTPPDFLYVYSLAVIGSDGAYEYLINKDVNYIRQAYPFPASQGFPKVYGQFDDNTLIVGPTPDAPYAVEMHFGYYPESIVTAGTSWLGDNMDSALLNGMLVEAARFMKSDQDIVALYGQMFTESVGLLKMLGDGKLRQDAYRSGQVRVPVQ
jgi:hypothetical protein